MDGIRRLLEAHPAVEADSVRVRFFRLGSFSLDIEVVAYFFAADWARFLEVQEQLLLSVTDIVRSAGTEIAFPSQTMYMSDPSRPQNSGIPEHLRAPEVRS